MIFVQLRKLRNDLRVKQGKTPDEDQMLKELELLNPLLDKQDYSLAAPDLFCPACGKKLG